MTTAQGEGAGEEPAGPAPGVGGGRRRSAGYGQLLKAVVYRDLLVWVRYPFNTVMGLLWGVFFFALMFYGGQLVAGQAINDTIEGLVVGYFLWTLALGAYMGVNNDIQAEASWGTLERHFVTPFGFGPVVFAKAIAVVFRTFLTSFLVLLVMILMTGITLDLNVVTIVVVGTLAILSAMGIGLAMGGLSVLYKRISNVANIFQFGLVGLISAPVFDIPLVQYLPLAQGSAMLQLAMQDGVRLWEYSPTNLAILLGTAVVYLALGYGVFVLTTRRARRLGVLGDY